MSQLLMGMISKLDTLHFMINTQVSLHKEIKEMAFLFVWCIKYFFLIIFNLQSVRKLFSMKKENNFKQNKYPTPTSER